MNEQPANPFEDYPLLGIRNLANALLSLVVMAPSFAVTGWLFSAGSAPGCADSAWLTEACLAAFVMEHPIASVNVLFLVNISVLFWLLSLAQRSGWLIDLYWTIIPVMIAHFYAAHPAADADPTRSAVALALIWIWSVRLTHNYFRRERWRFGAREDWRFTEQRVGRRHFWLSSFFISFASQQAVLVGLTLPFWAIHSDGRAWGWGDGVCAFLALLGIVIAGVADNQLRDYTQENARRRARGDAPLLLLDSGLWRHSRHPNYFGEQLFWWSLAGFGVVVGESWVMIGALLNTLLLVGITIMVERRMLARADRAAIYRGYRARTSAWIPWFRRSTGDGDGGTPGKGSAS